MILPLGINRRYRHVRRYRRIVEVLLKHGFGYLIQALDLDHLVPLRRRVMTGQTADRLSRTARLRMVLEELGPTFVKLGQVLSTRPDLIPQEFVQELELLQDKVPPFDFELVRRQLERELGAGIDEIFSAFEPQPIAAASIGQVHRAVLRDGTEVAVKIQRPDIEQLIFTDLEILYGLAHLVQDRLQYSVIRPVALVDEFSRIIKRELDYLTEARNISRFRRNFKGDERIHIPEVYWEYTSKRVLTMEYLHGVRVSDFDKLDELGVDRKKLSRVGAGLFLKMVLVDGFFHGDPHPGNLLVEKNGRIALLDYGMVGRISEEMMGYLADLFVGIVGRDIDRVIRGLSRMGVLDDDVDKRRLRTDMEELVDRHYGKSLRELEISAIVNDSLELTRKHRIILPADLVLLGKAMLVLEGLGKQLDPSFNALEIAEPFARELIKRRYHPFKLTRKAVYNASEYWEVFKKLPLKTDEVLSRLNRGDLHIGFRHEGLERLVNRLDIVSNRLSVALIIAAIIVGSSIIMQTNKGPLLWGFPVLGVGGYLVAALIGFWLIAAILRSGRL